MKFKMAALFYQPRRINEIQDGGFILLRKTNEIQNDGFILLPRKMNENQDDGIITNLK